MAWIPLAAAAATVVGNAMSQKGQKEINDANIQNSRDQRDYETIMANSAHQREVRDLQAAGLNPILSGTGGSGAATPTYSLPALQNTMGSWANSAKSFADVASSLQSREQSQAQVEQIRATTEQIRSNTLTNQLVTAKAMADLANTRENTRLTGEQAANVSTDTINKSAMTKGIAADSSAKQADADVAMATVKANIAQREAESQSAGYRADQLKAESSYFGTNAAATGIGKGLGPAMEMLKIIRMFTSAGAH